MLSKSSSAPSVNISKEELQTILKFGAQNLFKKHEESSNEPQNKLDTLDLDDLLARAEHTDVAADVGGAADGGAEFLEQWKVQDFGVSQLDWEDIIPEKERLAKLTTQEDLELFAGRRHASTPDADTLTPKKKKTQPKKRKAGTLTEMSEQEIRALVKAMQRFGHIDERHDNIVDDARLEDKDPDTLLLHATAIVSACKEFASKPQSPVEDESIPKPAIKTPSISYHGVTINPTTFIARLEELSSLNYRISEQKLTKGGAMTYRMSSALKPVTNWTCTWGQKDDAMLLLGVNRYGVGNWDLIQIDIELGLRTKFFLAKAGNDNADEKDKLLPKALHLQRRVEYLLRVLKEEEDAKGPRKEKKLPVKAKVSKRSTTRNFKPDSQDEGPFVNNPSLLLPKEHDQDYVSSQKQKGKTRSTRNSTAQQPVKKIAIKKRSVVDVQESIPTKPKKKRARKVPDDNVSSYESMDEKACKLIMIPLKSELRNLRVGKQGASSSEYTTTLRTTLNSIGDLINASVLGDDNAEKKEKHLWKFASYFWPLERTSSKKIKDMYRRLVTNGSTETVQDEDMHIK